MLAPTHLVFGQAAFLGASIATGHAPTLLQAIGSAAFALLPDVDKRQSIIGRMFPFISEPLDYHFGHRTLTHSLLFQCVVGLLLYWFIPFGWWLALISGLVSHTVGDMMTPQGVAWFWPSTRLVASSASGLVAFMASPASRGTALACRVAASRGSRVVVFPLGFAAAALPSLGAGRWVPCQGRGLWSGAWAWERDQAAFF